MKTGEKVAKVVSGAILVGGALLVGANVEATLEAGAATKQANTHPHSEQDQAFARRLTENEFNVNTLTMEIAGAGAVGSAACAAVLRRRSERQAMLNDAASLKQ